MTKQLVVGAIIALPWSILATLLATRHSRAERQIWRYKARANKLDERINKL